MSQKAKYFFSLWVAYIILEQCSIEYDQEQNINRQPI